MKIEISSIDGSGLYDYEVFDKTTGHRVIKNLGSFSQSRFFSEDDLCIILSDKQIKQFDNGKYEFEISGKSLSLVDDYYYKPSFGYDRNYLINKVEAEKILNNE